VGGGEQGLILGGVTTGSGKREGKYTAKGDKRLGDVNNQSSDRTRKEKKLHKKHEKRQKEGREEKKEEVPEKIRSLRENKGDQFGGGRRRPKDEREGHKKIFRGKSEKREKESVG